MKCGAGGRMFPALLSASFMLNSVLDKILQGVSYRQEHGLLCLNSGAKAARIRAVRCLLAAGWESLSL